jgi:hypothetical protein
MMHRFWHQSFAIDIKKRMVYAKTLSSLLLAMIRGLNGRLFATRDISLNGNLNIGGNLSVSQFSSNKTITTTNYQLVVAEDLSLNGRLFVSGNVGIGTTAPYTQFHMTGSSTGKIASLIANTNTAVGSSACLQFGTWAASGSGTGTSSPAAEIAGVCMNATFGRTDLTFSTYNETNSLTERMRITNGGYVGIGTTNPQFPLHVYSSSSDQSYSGWYGFNLGANGNTIRTGGTTNPTSIYANGSIVSRNSVLSVTNTFTSDNRIKKNIRLIDSEKALEMLTHITPKIYNFIDEFTLGTRDKYGLIAQELEEIFPESIGYTTEYIPNIFDVVDISTDGYTLTLKKVSTSISFPFSKATNLSEVTETIK